MRTLVAPVALFLFLVLGTGVVVSQQGGRISSPAHGRCEPITIPMCGGIQYNKTIFPNLLGHLNQDAAGQHMSQYVPLIKIDCSPHIHFFLCAMYAPVCTILDHPIPPCRGLCQAAKQNCEEVMLKFDYPWPPEFECSKFPVAGNAEELCVGNDQTTLSGIDLKDPSDSGGHPSSSFSGGRDRTGGGGGRHDNYAMDFKCPVQLQTPPELEYRLRIGSDQVIKDCGAPCYHNITFFNRDQIRYAHDWIFSLSIVCLLSCAFTLATFLMDRGRFPYPERPIVYLALCYGAVAVVFIIGYAYGEDISCNHSVMNKTMNFLTERTIKQVGIL